MTAPTPSTTAGLSSAGYEVSPLDAVHLLGAATPLPAIVRARGTRAGYFVQSGVPLKIAYAAKGQPYQFDDPITGLVIVEANNNIAKGPVAGDELDAFLANPDAAAEIDVPATVSTPVATPYRPGDVVTLQDGVLRVNGEPQATTTAPADPQPPASIDVVEASSDQHHLAVEHEGTTHHFWSSAGEDLVAFLERIGHALKHLFHLG